MTKKTATDKSTTEETGTDESATEDISENAKKTTGDIGAPSLVGIVIKEGDTSPEME